jgi:hypothetical protein
VVDGSFIRQAIMAPSASLAPHGGRWSQQQKSDWGYAIDAYPMVYGTDVWVKNALVISERKLPSGQIERIQVLSLGQYDGDVGGWLGEVEAIIYDSCCRVVVGTMDIRLGKIKQEPITDAFYVPCGDACCVCIASGDGPLFADTVNSVEVGVAATTDAGVISAWVVLADDQPIGTVWADTPGNYSFRVTGATAVELRAIPDASASAPQAKLTGSVSAPTTVGRMIGSITAANYVGVPQTPVDSAAQFTAILADIDPTCSGLAVVKTVTACQSTPTFRVKKGRQGRTMYAGGVVKTTITDALTAAIDNATLTVGATLENNHTGASWTLTENNALPAGVKFARGDTYSIWKLDTLLTLPEVYVDLVRSVGGGLNQLVSRYSLDYEYLQKSADYCFARNNLFNGVVRKQPLSYFIQNAAPQSGLIVTRRENRTGLYPADPNQRPTRIYTIANTNDQAIVWEPFDYHATNRLLINYPNKRKCGNGTLIAQDIQLKKERLAVVEEALLWEYVDNTEQASALAIEYFNAVRFQRIVCKFTATTPAYYLEPGDIFEFTTPIWEVGAEFSGRVLDGSSPNRLIPSWEPMLYSGVVKGTAGNTIIDDSIDFTQLVAVGDLAATMDGSSTASVVGVESHKITLSAPLPINAGYRVLDLTLSDALTLTWDAWNTSKQYKYNTADTLKATWDAALKRVIYTGAGDIPPGSAIVLAEHHWLWRCAVVEPINAGAFRIYGTVFYPDHDHLIRTHLIT